MSGGGARRPTLPALLRAAVDPATGRPLTEADVRSEAITMFGAGTETVSTTLTWLIDELVRHPRIEARVLAELDEHLPAGTVPTPEALARLAYTRAVTQEVVRLHAPNAFLMRTARVPVTLGAYRIPAGTELLYSLTAVHRDPALHPDPLRFDPGRWYDADGAEGTGTGGTAAARQAFLPFGAGKHKCIGEAFAWAELTVATAAILRRWRPTAVPNSRAREVVWTTVQAQGLRVRLAPRGGNQTAHASGARRTPAPGGLEDTPARCLPIAGPRRSTLLPARSTVLPGRSAPGRSYPAALHSTALRTAARTVARTASRTASRTSEARTSEARTSEARTSEARTSDSRASEARNVSRTVSRTADRTGPRPRGGGGSGGEALAPGAGTVRSLASPGSASTSGPPPLSPGPRRRPAPRRRPDRRAAPTRPSPRSSGPAPRRPAPRPNWAPPPPGTATGRSPAACSPRPTSPATSPTRCPS